MNLLNLFKSKTRKELFKLYFTNPDSEYYLRQLESMLNIPVSMIRKELIALEKNGLFESFHKGNLLFYRLNKNYPIFYELKSIVFKTIGVEGTLKELLTKLKDVKAAFIYGSFANGKENANSDIDLFLIGNIDEDALIRGIRKVEGSIKREINYTLYDKKEFDSKKSRKDSFIENVLESSIIMLVGRKNEL